MCPVPLRKLVRDGLFDQNVPHRAQALGVEPSIGSLVFYIGQYLRLARFVTHRSPVSLYSSSGIHIAEAACHQRNEGSVDGINAFAHLRHGVAIFGTSSGVGFRHGRAFRKRMP